MPFHFMSARRELRMDGKLSLKVTRSPQEVVHPAGESTPGGYYFLGNLDQNLVVTMKTVYCFQATDYRSSDDVERVLRTSLEKVLVEFYPFDGRFAVGNDGKLAVKLDGSGVPFVAAAADCEIEQLGDISIPEPEKLGQLVFSPPASNVFEEPLLAVQVTKFKCGGFSLGMAMNHSLCDGISAVEFLQAWAETARDLPLSLPPFLDRSILAARRPPAIEYPHQEYADIAESLSSPEASNALPLIHRCFILDPPKIHRLKQLATGDEGAPPSSFVALSGLVWRFRTMALNTPQTDPTKLLFAVDGRSRLEPPLPAGFFGNGIVFACCLCPAGDLVNRPLSHAVRMIQEANRGITDRSIRSAIDHYEVNRVRPSLAGTLVITAWTRLGFRATDFGWGCAAQTAPAELPGREVALFLPHGEDGKSTAVILGLPAPAMLAFQKMMDF